MKRQMAGDGAQAQSHSFLLDDDSAVPFNLEDIGSIYDGVDLLDGIPVPNAIHAETKGFDFLKDREKLPTPN
jgi:myosin-5